jgi:uncharacterized protein
VLTDEQGILGRGWRFPVLPDARGRLGWSTGEQDIEEAVFLVLSTARGERLMLPEFGTTARDSLFESADDLARAAIAESVREALVRWEPRIIVQDIDVDAPGETPNMLLVRISYVIKRTNAVHNIVFPYYVTEGGG